MHSKLHIYSKLVIILYIVILAVPPFARALPEGHNVESGEVDFAYPNEHTLNITADDKAVINFNSFNINENETVNFIQPSEIYPHLRS